MSHFNMDKNKCNRDGICAAEHGMRGKRGALENKWNRI